MKRLSPRSTQRIRILSLFHSGVSMPTLAQAWNVPVETIEALIRAQMKAQP